MADEQVQQPDADVAELGQCRQHLAGDQGKAARPRVQPDLALDPHQGIRATRMSTRSPTNGTPSASSRARWRPPLASVPSARTTRHQGTPGSELSCRTLPAYRGAPGQMSP